MSLHSTPCKNATSINKCPKIYFTGVGGQGTLTATALLGRAAMEAGIEVVGGEVHGMAQRGGVVESALLLGGWRSPRIDTGEADIILGFEPLETLRGLPYLREGGAVFSSANPLPPASVNLGKDKYPEMALIESEIAKVAARMYFLPCLEIGREAGAIQAGNTALLGALCASGLLPFGLDVLERTIRSYLPAKIQDANLYALGKGAEFIL